MFESTYFWLFIAYVAGSVATFYLVYRSILTNAIGNTVDTLIEQGYIKSKTLPSGEVEILKWNSND